MGKKSVLDNTAIWAQELNIELTDDEAVAVLEK